MTTKANTEATETMLENYLRSQGECFSGSRARVVCIALAETDKPVSSQELLFLVQRLDSLVSHGTVSRYLKILTSAGLAVAIPPANPRGSARFELVRDRKQTPEGCTHRHLVCNDCGALVEAEKVGALR